MSLELTEGICLERFKYIWGFMKSTRIRDHIPEKLLTDLFSMGKYSRIKISNNLRSIFCYFKFSSHNPGPKNT